MRPVNVTAMFCEDIREEKRETVSLIGILPDNINLHDPSTEAQDDNGAKITSTIYKLCLYVRINFDPHFDIGQPNVRLIMSDGEIIEVGELDLKVLERAKDQAIKNGNPLAGLISRVAITPLKVSKSGLIKAEVLILDEWQLAGVLNVHINSSSERSQPA